MDQTSEGIPLRVWDAVTVPQLLALGPLLPRPERVAEGFSAFVSPAEKASWLFSALILFLSGSLVLRVLRESQSGPEKNTLSGAEVPE